MVTLKHHVETRIMAVKLIIQPLFVTELLGDAPSQCRKIQTVAIDPNPIPARGMLKVSNPINHDYPVTWVCQERTAFAR